MYYAFSPSPSRSSYTTAPIDMPSSSSRPHSPSCAFPSWPRRSSLSSTSSNEDRDPPSLFISDDDLEDLFPSVFDDADTDCTPITSPYAPRSPGEPTGAAHQHQVAVDSHALTRELIKEEKAKKEKKLRRSRTSSSRRSRTSSSGKRMSPILETNNE